MLLQFIPKIPWGACALGFALFACASQDPSNAFEADAGGGGLDGGGTTPGAAGSGTEAANDTHGASGPDADSGVDDGGTIKLDVASPNNPDGVGGDGCGKVDFLFVIDNSGSMQDEQLNLINSFPGFIATVQSNVAAQDYQILVTDVDDDSCTKVSCDGATCATIAPSHPCVDLCMSCGGIGCDVALGGGIVHSSGGNECEFAGGQRYITDSEPDLQQAFSCAASVGIEGDGIEKPMEAIVEAVGPLQSDGACNAGFIRDDAILVVTFITDEEDDPIDPTHNQGGSNGDPASWRAALIAAKNGNEDAIVVLGLIGDPDAPGGLCTPLTPGGVNGGEASPRLRAFAESFSHGQWGSVCAPDYGPFFESAVGTIALACDEFEPEG